MNKFSQIRPTCLRAITFVAKCFLMLGGYIFLSTGSISAQPIFKFAFANNRFSTPHTLVTVQDTFSQKKGYGFENPINLIASTNHSRKIKNKDLLALTNLSIFLLSCPRAIINYEFY